MHKPTVYLDTNIFTFLFSSYGGPQNLYRHLATRGWWDTERSYFQLFSSGVTEGELRRGLYTAQERALNQVRRLPYFALTRAAEEHARAYVTAGLVPSNKRFDALQLALATVHRVDYLMTWNQAHLANPVVQARLEAMNRKVGLRTPWLVTPESIPKVALGQEIRRGYED